MPPDALHCFYALAERQSYPEAAQALGIRPKVLSDTVRTLEQQMGVPLLVASRGLHAVRLTRAGETLKALSPQFFAEQNRLCEQVQAVGQRMLRVAISGGGALLEVESLTRLRRSLSQPQPAFTLVRAPLSRQRAGIKHDEFDVGLSQVANSVEDQGLVVEAAWREPLAALLPQSHLLAAHEKLYPSMLVDFRLIVADEHFDDYGSQIDQLLRAHGVTDVSHRQEESNASEVILAVLGGRGVGLLGATQWTHSNQLAHLAALPVVDEQIGEPLWLTTYLRRPLTTNPVLTEAMAQFKARLAISGIDPFAPDQQTIATAQPASIKRGRR